jgi:hypothetical protein
MSEACEEFPNWKKKSILICNPRILRICWAKNDNFGNLTSCSFHQLTGFIGSPFIIVVQQEIDNLKADIVSLVTLVDIGTLKMESTEKFANQGVIVLRIGVLL